MELFLSGLISFFLVHSLRLYAPHWREAQRKRLGPWTWKALISIVSIATLVALVVGYGRVRGEPPVFWTAPLWMHHVTALLVLVAFVFFAAAYVPRNRIKAATGHPMTIGIKTWAFAHLLSNGGLADVLLFGGFFVWAIAVYAVSRRRDRAAGATPPKGTLRGDVITVVAGAVAFAIFAHFLHRPLIGVSPFP
jgi:uncharacterized membrane protein